MRILAVDDDQFILDLLAGSLTAKDRYDLVCCDSAEAALTLIETEKTPFDCFLLDIMLPGVDGIELCDMLRQSKRYRTTPILMITASREADLMERAFYAGATDFVSKPLEAIELSARINSAAMLNDSLHRERDMRHSLAELTEKTKLRFEEEVVLAGTGVSTLAGLENDLLRMPGSCYAMTLVSIDISGLRGIHRAVSGAQFRAHLEAVAHAAMAVTEGMTLRLAYTGNGRYLGVMIGRGRLDRTEILTRMTAQLSQTWDVEATGTPMPPQLLLGTLSDQRLWSGLSASDELRAHLKSRDIEPPLSKSREERLFTRPDVVPAEAERIGRPKVAPERKPVVQQEPKTEKPVVRQEPKAEMTDPQEDELFAQLDRLFSAAR